MPPDPTADARATWRAHLAARSGEASGGHGLRVAVAASFTPEPLEPYIGTALLGHGVVRPSVVFADYNQLHQVCLDPTAALGSRPDRLVLLWRIEDVFERDLVDALSSDADATRRLVDGVAELTDLVVACARREHLPIVFGVPPTPHGLGLDPYDPSSSVALGRLHQRLCALVTDAVDGVDGIRLVDHRRLVEEVGGERAHDLRGMLLYRQPYRTAMVETLGRAVGAAVASFDHVPPKVIVLDCDNTLWGGIVGEDGADGIAIGGTFPGNAFQLFQLALQRLARQGVLLAVCSKNDADDVATVFRSRTEMVLRPDDIATWRVNWQPKSENIRSIAAELNLAVDSFVFVDDSDFELAEVTTALPGVRTLRVPDETAELPDLLAASGLFRGRRVTAEDVSRTAMVQDEQRRARVEREVSAEEFLASLGLRVEFVAAGQEHVVRVAQLVNKTNQFNLTTRRRTEAEIADLVSSDDHHVFAISVDDRFGSYGLVGAVIVDATDPSVWELDTFLMSCRVLRRGVESALLAAVASRARRATATRLVGCFVATAKNGQVEGFYVDHGFTAIGQGRFVLDLADAALAPPAHIDLVGDA